MAKLRTEQPKTASIVRSGSITTPLYLTALCAFVWTAVAVAAVPSRRKRATASIGSLGRKAPTSLTRCLSSYVCEGGCQSLVATPSVRHGEKTQSSIACKLAGRIAPFFSVSDFAEPGCVNCVRVRFPRFLRPAPPCVCEDPRGYGRGRHTSVQWKCVYSACLIFGVQSKKQQPRSPSISNEVPKQSRTRMDIGTARAAPEVSRVTRVLADLGTP